MTASYETIELRTDGPIAIITLNRPGRLNAINKKMLDELKHALDAIEEDQGVRALVIIGSGGNFSSGFDLHEQMMRRPVGVGPWSEILDRDFRTIMRFWHLSKPMRLAADVLVSYYLESDVGSRNIPTLSPRARTCLWLRLWNYRRPGTGSQPAHALRGEFHAIPW